MRYEFISGHNGRDGVLTEERETETRFLSLRATDDAAFWVEYRIFMDPLDAYILLPACAYDGNRFDTSPRPYPPMFREEEFRANAPVRMTGVPALSREGTGFLDVTTGDLSTPAVCILDRSAGEAFLLFTEQGYHGRNHGVTVEQREDGLIVRLRAPAKRRLVYRWYDGVPSLRENPEADPPLSLPADAETIIGHRLYILPCAGVPELFRLYFEKRGALYHGTSPVCLPFSVFWDLAEEEQNRTHFREPEGYYALDAQVGIPSRYGQWQAGWVGGGMGTLALLCDGTSLSRDRSIRTLEFAARLQSKAGFFYGCWADGKVVHDCFGKYGDKHSMLLIRKQADMVFFLFRHLAAMEKRGFPVPVSVRHSAIAGADAIVKLWERYGELGQFVNAETGDILVGGSTAGAMAPAALCAASAVTGERRYARTARELGDYFRRTAIVSGVTTGGPGEILSAPDSESAAALLESFTALWEQDGDPRWLSAARDAAHQLSSWVVPYDYAFPPESRFGRMGVHTAGSVWANVQNKHSAPGLCTLSPAAFLKLYRATGETGYLDLMTQIARFSPQVVSIPERPVMSTSGKPLRPGELCERVNLSDWEGAENVGDSIFGPSAWPMAAMMLTHLEIPGVYAVPERGVVCASDHILAWLENSIVFLENPTAFPARVKALIESVSETALPLGLDWQDRLRTVFVAPGETVRLQ